MYKDKKIILITNFKKSEKLFNLAVANLNFTTRMPVFELKLNFISIQNFKAGNVKPPGMHWSKDF